MKIEIETSIELYDVSNAIYQLTKREQIEVLISLLRSVDTETARRAIARWEEV